MSFMNARYLQTIFEYTFMNNELTGIWFPGSSIFVCF
jgi:hypothetical protein